VSVDTGDDAQRASARYTMNAVPCDCA
jgi:hypothetical protein